MKNSYEILSPFFMKLAGFCVSIFLCILCVKLFVLNPKYAYWQTNASLVLPIILGAFILCVCFFMFILMKVNNSRIYLFSLYLIYSIKCVLFLFVLKARAGTGFNTSMIYNINMMLKIILCLGFLFIFLEFLHAQTSKTFIRDKSILAGIMGLVPCISILISHVRVFIIIAMCPYLLGILYALRIFTFSLLGKKDKTSMLFKCSFLAFLILWALFTTQAALGLSVNVSIWNPFTLVIFIIFGCALLIPLQYKQSANAIIDLFEKPFEAGIYMLVIRFLYFALLAEGIATIWRG